MCVNLNCQTHFIVVETQKKQQKIHVIILLKIFGNQLRGPKKVLPFIT